MCGPQRDIDRARALKRNPKQTQNEKDGLTPLQRKERCVCAAPRRARGRSGPLGALGRPRAHAVASAASTVCACVLSACNRSRLQ